MTVNTRQITICICTIGTIILLLPFFAVLAQSPTDIEQRAKQLEQQLQGTSNPNKLIETYRNAIQLMDDANRKVGGLAGMQTMSIEPAETPEKEMERRREIINSQHHQIKSMTGNLSAGTEKLEIPEVFPLEGYIVVNGGEKDFFNNEVKTDLLYTITERFVGNLTGKRSMELNLCQRRSM